MLLMLAMTAMSLVLVESTWLSRLCVIMGTLSLTLMTLLLVSLRILFILYGLVSARVVCEVTAMVLHCAVSIVCATVMMLLLKCVDGLRIVILVRARIIDCDGRMVMWTFWRWVRLVVILVIWTALELSGMMTILLAFV